MEQSPSIYDNIKGQNSWKNNGLVGDIRSKKTDNINFNVLEYNNNPDTKTLKNCNTQDSLKGILDETLLSNTFFSTGNVENIQLMIRYYFHKEKGQVISDQSNNELLTIMRAIFLKYSNAAANTNDEILFEVRELNNLVVEYSLKQIYINFDNYNRYINDLEKLPLPIDLPKVPNKNNYTYNMSRGEDFA